MSNVSMTQLPSVRTCLFFCSPWMERGAFSAAARGMYLTLRANIPGLSEIPCAGLGEGGSNGQLGDFSESVF